MQVFKESEEIFYSQFPLDVFIRDNSIMNISCYPHWHDYIEILYILEGSALQKINERFMWIHKNDIVILGSGDIHSTTCEDGTSSKILVFKFQPEVIEPAYSNVIESSYIISFLNSTCSKHFNIISEEMDDIHHDFLKLYEEYSKKEPGYEIFIKSYMYRIIGSFVRRGLIQLYNPGEFADGLKRLNPLLKHIEKCYDQEISTSAAAKMVNLSYYYFSRYFKKIIGKSFVEYVDYVRVCEAEKLILKGNLNIAQAAFEVGYKNVCSFNKVYKRIRGYSPGKLKANSANNQAK